MEAEKEIEKAKTEIEKAKKETMEKWYAEEYARYQKKAGIYKGEEDTKEEEKGEWGISSIQITVKRIRWH